ncbi:hypothetical protein K505DRAFT_321510 [Melanomma pulvis-pyrius CBS 109.77]|uniref:Uncharacterized protein n=1 Tax=Melanomma pulvis-pyrius CBS 109.77 TaxID=1314802 RepID=A0A6A6XQR2_9PLEO|nr:hypothetical protein K505DRAFT_321510 [Melanomma pulvis-pyrius CBS 109.77]
MSVARLLGQHKFRLFACNYAPTYKTFITHRVQDDVQHPLNEVQRRLSRERKREGLWWNVTVGVTLSKAKVVRSWVRRRLQSAFIEELRERDIEQDGKLIVDKAGKVGRHGIPAQVLKQLGDVSLMGSVRLHARPTVILAKYADVRRETGLVADALLQGLKAELKFAEPRSERKMQGLLQPRKAQVPPRYMPGDT